MTSPNKIIDMTQIAAEDFKRRDQIKNAIAKLDLTDEARQDLLFETGMRLGAARASEGIAQTIVTELAALTSTAQTIVTQIDAEYAIVL